MIQLESSFRSQHRGTAVGPLAGLLKDCAGYVEYLSKLDAFIARNGGQCNHAVHKFLHEAMKLLQDEDSQYSVAIQMSSFGSDPREQPGGDIYIKYLSDLDGYVNTQIRWGYRRAAEDVIAQSTALLQGMMMGLDNKFVSGPVSSFKFVTQFCIFSQHFLKSGRVSRSSGQQQEDSWMYL